MNIEVFRDWQKLLELELSLPPMSFQFECEHFRLHIKSADCIEETHRHHSSALVRVFGEIFLIQRTRKSCQICGCVVSTSKLFRCFELFEIHFCFASSFFVVEELSNKYCSTRSIIQPFKVLFSNASTL